MSQAVEQLLQAALSLSDDEQAQLVAALLAAEDGRRLGHSDEDWMTEVRRRSAEYDKGGVPTYFWAEGKERIADTIPSRADDNLIDGLIEHNAEFRELLTQSLAGPREPLESFIPRDHGPETQQ